MNDDNTFLPVPEDYEIDPRFIRYSQDSGTVNSRGRNLLEICTALNLRIFNGTILGDLLAARTDAPSLNIIDYYNNNRLLWGTKLKSK